MTFSVMDFDRVRDDGGSKFSVGVDDELRVRGRALTEGEGRVPLASVLKGSNGQTVSE
jgi:hypothetical protein